MNLIVAVSGDFAIGKDNDLLFNLPSDLKYFKEKTTNKVVVMGERTYMSLPKRPLKNRINIVLSSNPEFVADGAKVVHSLEELFLELKQYDSSDVYVCGGASVYNLLMDYCTYAYVTKVDKIVPADTYINNIDKKENWKLVSQSEIMEENDLKFTFCLYKNFEVK